MTFPVHRPRRLRRTPALRALVRETELSPGDLVAPLFVTHGSGRSRAIGSMPGHAQLSVDLAVEEARSLVSLGVGGFLLFGIPEHKDDEGTAAWDERGPVPMALRAIRTAIPAAVLMADVCLDEYTSHGHCGVLRTRADGSMDVDNDATVARLAKIAVTYARAGADVVAPSDMMDGRVRAIRGALDESGFEETVIMSYAAKYASAYYGPFREAAECAPRFGDRAGYQMDPGNVREAIREVLMDVDEGADIVMVKPALPYLDVIARVRDAVNVPIAAYNVSGEYAMVHAAAQRGWIDLERAALESLYSIKRAGADVIVTYHARDVAKALAG
jgi:porphobilinogen synthase